MAEYKFPTEVVDLPSKGLLYPKDSPLSSGKVEIKYEHPLLEDISKETYGILIYQEQVMQATQLLAGYTLGGADQ